LGTSTSSELRLPETKSVGTLRFYAKKVDANVVGNFKVSKKTNAGTWTVVQDLGDISNLTYQEFSVVVNQTATDSMFVRIEITKNGDTFSSAGYNIDDISYTADLSTSNITIAISAGEGGSVSQSYSTYYPGETATVTATPTSGYHFVNWSESGSPVSTDATYRFLAVNRTLVANFEPNTVAVSSGTTNAADITCTTCDVTVASDAELTVETSKTLKSVTVAAGGKLTLNNAGTLNITNGITLQNTASGTASFVDSRTAVNPTAIAGTVEQVISETNRNWYVAVPVSGKLASDITLSGAKVVERDEINGEWDDVTGSLFAGKGYIATASTTGGNATWTLAGNLNSGKVEVGVTRSGTGFNLLGNPYPSYMNWEQVLSLNATNETLLQPSIWYRTKSGASYSFQTYNSAGRIATPTGTTGYIPPMQAFWIRANAAGTVTFTNAMRSHGDGASNKLKAPKVNTQQIIRLQVNNGTATDEVLIYFDAAASNAYDAFDSPKFAEANTVTQIYTSVGAEKLVINGMSTMPLDTPIGLGFVPGSATTFSIKANEISNLSTGVKVILKDNVTLAETDLTDGVSSYQFSPETTSTDRFSIIFRSSGVSTAIGKDNFDNLPLNVYKNRNNQIVIQRAVSQNATVTVCNAIGQKLFSSQMTGSSMVIDKAFDAGVYFVTLSITGIKTTQKIIIN
jgi:hypothetical protein